VACIAIVALIALKAYYGHGVGAAAVAAPNASSTAGAVTALHSRISRGGRLEVWGSTSAPDGASIELNATSSSGFVIDVRPAPAISGHFYGSTRVPRWLRGGRTSVIATVAP
jgi:hypothetical protein